MHAAWNLRLKTAADPLRVAAVALPLGTLLLTPAVGAAWLAGGRPGLPWPAWGLAALSGLVELAYFHTLSAAYRRGDVSSVYPVARGTAPVLAALAGVLLLHERLTPLQAAGVVLLISGVWLARPPPGSPRNRGAPPSSLRWGYPGVRISWGGLVASRAALVPAVLTGVLIAVYTTVDTLGVRLGPFWLYAWAVFGATSLWLLPWARPGLTSQALPVGVLTIGAYGMALAALSLAPLALVAPLRESGVVVVALWGVFRLGERDRASLKVGGAAAVLAGAALLAIG